jgi:hypothetical protein
MPTLEVEETDRPTLLITVPDLGNREWEGDLLVEPAGRYGQVILTIEGALEDGSDTHEVTVNAHQLLRALHAVSAFQGINL